VTHYYNIKYCFYVNVMYFKMLFIPVMAKLDFQQSSVAYDNLGIILILVQICLSNQIIKPLKNLKSYSMKNGYSF